MRDTASGEKGEPVAWGRPVLPREHGVWAMLLLPLLLGATVGGWTAIQLALVAGAVLLFLSLSALLEGLRRRGQEAPLRFLRWAGVYLLAGAAALVLPLRADWRIILPGLLGGLGLPVELFFLLRRQERALLNGLASVAALSCGALATYLLGQHALDERAAWLWLLCTLHFAGSLLFVRSMIRQRGSRPFRWLVVGYHAGMAAGLLVWGYSLVAGAFAVGLVRSVLCWRRALRPVTIGMVELGASILFFALTALTFRSPW